MYKRAFLHVVARRRHDDEAICILFMCRLLRCARNDEQRTECTSVHSCTLLRGGGTTTKQSAFCFCADCFAALAMTSSVPNVQVCDATYDAMKYNCRVNKIKKPETYIFPALVCGLSLKLEPDIVHPVYIGIIFIGVYYYSCNF